MRTVIFDLDGTLADTSGDLLAAANACFIGLGHGPQLGPQDAGTALRGGRAMLRLGFSRLGGATEAEIDIQYPVLLQAYAKNIDTHTVMYPGAIEAVKTLNSQGVKVGICTNKPEGLAETLMQNLGVRDLFGSLIGADTLPVRKPDPAPFHEAVARAGGDSRRALLVGDSDTDHSTARAAGVPSVLVTFGPAGGDMAALQPDALLSDFADLPDLAAHLLT
ncbi:HAD-IA family hydrolase [Actibacterium sp. 188UL27-1]|uniref:HAD-IA family hydrolase n=1 Tax=Actibacterium sp. 188UL27-1 TaxID=2786961 RepID=UPI00195B5395|nr:HAD-IA family hydrolase [Actibacterium sp. 188UL27-1]MBM7067788.1 HAD-IA family hydrolase [Actibacterium sp. 188UL27-1]